MCEWFYSSVDVSCMLKGCQLVRKEIKRKINKNWGWQSLYRVDFILRLLRMGNCRWRFTVLLDFIFMLILYFSCTIFIIIMCWHSFSKFLVPLVRGLSIVVMIFTERQNRKLLEQLEEQKKRLRIQNQQHSAASTSSSAATGWVWNQDLYPHVFVLNSGTSWYSEG